MRTLVFVLLVLLAAGCARETPPEQKQADQLLTQAREAYGRSAFQESRSLFRSALAANDRLGRLSQAAEALEHLAALEAAAGRLDSAIVLYRAAAERHRSLADRDAVRLATLQWASLCRRMGDDRKAYELLTEALRLAELFKEQEGIGELRWALAAVCRDLELGEEQSHLDALLQSAMVSGNSAALARVERENGLSAHVRGDATGAIEHLLKALTYAGQSRDSLLTIDVLCRLAMAYTAAGNTRQAFEAYTDALRRTDVTRGAERIRYEMLTRVGTVYLRGGSFAEAARFYRPALTGAMAVGDRLAEGYLFVQLGHCEAQTPGGLDNAVRNYRAALELFTAAGYHRGAAYALTGLGAAAEGLRQLTDALQYYRQAVAEEVLSLDRRPPDDVYEECEQGFRIIHGPAIEDPLIALLLQLGRNDEAFWFVEQKQERELAADLARMELQTGESAVDAQLELWTNARRQCLGAERQLAVLLTAGPAWQPMLAEVKETTGFQWRRMEEAGALIVRRRPAFAALVKPSGLTLTGLQQSLPRGSALLAYAPGIRSLYSFVVTGTGTTVHVFPAGRDALQGQVSEFWSLLNRRVGLEDSTAEMQKAADRRLQELCTLLYPPFFRSVEGAAGMAADLLVMLPREFGQLPLHALRRGMAGSMRRYIAEQIAVHYLPAASSLALPAVAPKQGYSITAIGHPGTTEWDVEYELRDIRAFSKDAVLLFGRDATFEAMRRASGDILHLAGELRFGVRSAGNSMLLLSDGKSADGTRATPWGLLPELPPRSALLISDLGAHSVGKNAALAQIALMSGTRTVVLHDFTPLRRSRKVFGEGFYTALQSGARPVDAFRQAQLQMTGDARGGLHHWAAFSLWGK
jgi:tetratricopeptide (TPR) repeat protein